MSEPGRAIETIPVREFREADGTADWPVLGDGATTFFRTASLATSARLIEAISRIEGIEGQRPDIDVRPDGVTVRLITYTAEWYGMSREDVERARRISAIAAELGLVAEPSVVQTVGSIVIGAIDITKVMPFWQALLGYERRRDSPDEDLVDPGAGDRACGSSRSRRRPPGDPGCTSPSGCRTTRPRPVSRRRSRPVAG